MALARRGVIAAAILLYGCGRTSETRTASTDTAPPASPDPPYAVHSVQGISVEYLLTPERCSLLGGAPGRDFDVAPDGKIVMTNENGLLELEAGLDGVVADRLAQTRPDSFSLDGKGAVLSISNQFLGELEDGQFSKIVPLPDAGMRLMPSSVAGVVYVIGNAGEPSCCRLYGFFSDGTLQIEAEVPEPIVAAADNRSAVYLASKHNLFRVTSKAIDVVARLPDSVGAITSIAAAPDDSALYFTTDRETFVMSGLAAVTLLQDLGGIARMRNNNLYIWSPDRQVLVSVKGLAGFLETHRGTT
jgi:hypothetical protein